jgi:hypothetical protein
MRREGVSTVADGKMDVLDAANQVIVLAFDLVDSEIERIPSRLVEVLDSPQVQNSIKKTLLDFAKTRIKAGVDSTVVSDQDARKLFDSLGRGVTDAASQRYLDDIKKTPEYRALERSVTAFKTAAKSSSLGVWVDRNRGILYVVGAALVVGTASVLYVAQTGGAAVDLALDPLRGKDFEILQVGSISIKAGVWDFKPDARVLGARIAASKQWDKVSVELKLGVLAQETRVQEVQGQALVTSGAFSVSLTGAAKPQVSRVNLGLKLDYSGRVGEGKFNIGIGAMYKDDQLSGTVGAGGTRRARSTSDSRAAWGPRRAAARSTRAC